MRRSSLGPAAAGTGFTRTASSGHGAGVKVWEPPKRLLLDWQISHEWGYQPDLHTDVEFLFTAVGEAETRIDFERRGLEAFGDSEAAANTRAGMDRGWGLILEGFKAAVGG